LEAAKAATHSLNRTKQRRRRSKKLSMGFWTRHQEAGVKVGSVVVFLAVWEVTVRAGLLDPFFVSSPSAILAAYYDLFVRSRTIYPDLAASFCEGTAGLGLSIALGVPVGALMGRIRIIRLILEPFMMAFYSTPLVALLPVVILWFGVGLFSKVFLIFLGGFFMVAINTQAGVANTDPHLIETARSFTAREHQILFKIVLPSAVPFIIAGVRLAVGRVLILLVVAEMYASMKGIGYLIMRAGATGDSPVLLAGVILLASVGVTVSRALTVVQRRAAPWLPAEGY
jgi:ABC-type nitrate/sulfonate/bicarbonate transport system permease component